MNAWIGSLWLSSIASLTTPASALEVKIPFPAVPLFEGEQRVCLHAVTPFAVSSTEVEDSGFRISCSTIGGEQPTNDLGSFQPRRSAPISHVVRVCVTILEGTSWPTRVPQYACVRGMQELVVQPVIGFDPNDDITDGVEILSTVDTLAGAFLVPHLPDTPGIMAFGTCGIERGILWIELKHPQSSVNECVLVSEDREFVVPVRLVPALEKRKSPTPRPGGDGSG